MILGAISAAATRMGESMDQEDSQSPTFQDDLEHCLTEQEKIRAVIGEIGGARAAQSDKVVTIVFILVLIALFVLDIAREAIGVGKEFLPG